MSFGRLGHGSRSGALSSASCLAGPKGRLRPRQKRIGQADAQQEIHFAERGAAYRQVSWPSLSLPRIGDLSEVEVALAAGGGGETSRLFRGERS